MTPSHSRKPLPRQSLLNPVLSLAALAPLLVAAGCWDGATEPSPDAPRPTTVTVSPATAELAALGATVQLTVQVLDQNGQVMTGATVTWASSTAAVATVSASGLVRGAGEGTATITATSWDDVSGTSEITVFDPDRAALVALYNATDGPNWVDNTNWLTVGPVGEWYGVDTNADARVVGIDLAGRWDYQEQQPVFHGLRGELPGELANLTQLTSLRLSINDLSGPVPRELGSLSNLGSLFLSRNALSGPIPAELGNLANLRDLNLSGNALSGPIPPELGDLASLESLRLDQNALAGPIPAELGNLASLRDLNLLWNALAGAIPAELGNLPDLRRLILQGNALSGEIPPELGNLASLESLFLGENDLSGVIPQSFLQLDQLQGFFVGGQDVCVPGVSAFVAWFDGIGSRETKADIFCNRADVAALESLYDLTDGANWTASDGWLSHSPVENWHGVTADALGHVTELALEGNGLAGRLPGTLGNLLRMTVLRIGDNALDDRMPLSLTALDLDEFHYDGTDLCEPADADFQRWLEGIASRRGTGAQCAPLTERDVLTALHASTGGPGWTKSHGWLSEASLRRWHGVEVDAQGRVVGLRLSRNGLSGEIPPELGGLSNLGSLILNENALSGAIPPELGDLSNLGRLYFGGNDLAGAIPSELGNLANLRSLDLSRNTLSGAIPPALGGLSNLEEFYLFGNALSGAIPPALGDLSNLEELTLYGNDLSGAIPPELGDLSNLRWLYFGGNDLAGAIPAELGDLANLERLSLAANDLSGPLPPTFGGLASLRELQLAHNAELAGAIPAGLRDLALESLIASGTNLCVPLEPAFEEWLATIPRRRIAVCGEPPAAYLVQAVQSLAHPVPLVAGEEALLRVFVTAAMETTEGIPDVRARST